MSTLAARLCGTALLAGAAGTWSPCGFSMIDTIAAGTRSGRPRITLASCVAFAAGALLEKVVLFAGLGAAGYGLAAIGVGPPTFAAAGLAAGLAVAELAGIPVRPQVRFQVPEHWRRARLHHLRPLGRAPAGTDAGFDPGHTRQGSGTGPCPHRRAARSLAWTTALDGRSAYVSFIRPAAGLATRASLVRFRFRGRR